MKRLRAWLPLLVLLVTGFVLLATGALGQFEPARLASRHEAIRLAIAAQPATSALMHVGVMALVTATAAPGAVLVVFAGGVFFGGPLGALLSTIGATLGALALFLASRKALANGSRKPPALLGRAQDHYRAWPLSYTLFLRLVPVFPFGAVTLVLAWLRCPAATFVLATLVGGSVMIGLQSFLAASLADALASGMPVSTELFARPAILVPLFGMALLALAPILVARLRG